MLTYSCLDPHWFVNMCAFTHSEPSGKAAHMPSPVTLPSAPWSLTYNGHICQDQTSHTHDLEHSVRLTVIWILIFGNQGSRPEQRYMQNLLTQLSLILSCFWLFQCWTLWISASLFLQIILCFFYLMLFFYPSTQCCKYCIIFSNVLPVADITVIWHNWLWSFVRHYAVRCEPYPAVCWLVRRRIFTSSWMCLTRLRTLKKS